MRGYNFIKLVLKFKKLETTIYDDTENTFPLPVYELNTNRRTQPVEEYNWLYDM